MTSHHPGKAAPRAQASMAQRSGRFRTLRQAQGKARRIWTCAGCLLQYNAKPSKGWSCPVCHCSEAPVYFQSQREADRYASLRLQQQHGLISDLEVHPPYPITVTTPAGSAEDVAKYIADFRYRRGGMTVVEDVKASTSASALDPVFKLKRRLVEAQHGITITPYTGR